MNYSQVGMEVSGQVCYDDFSTHTPSVPSAVISQLKNEDGEVLLETEIKNTDMAMAKMPFIRAAGEQFHAEVQQYIDQLEREQR